MGVIREGVPHGLARRRRDQKLLQDLIVDPNHGPAEQTGHFS